MNNAQAYSRQRQLQVCPSTAEQVYDSLVTQNSTEAVQRSVRVSLSGNKWNRREALKRKIPEICKNLVSIDLLLFVQGKND